MSKAKCQVTFKSFKWNPTGYREVLNSGEVQGLMDDYAARVMSDANADFTTRPDEGQGYTRKQIDGRIAKGYLVKADTPHAIASDHKHNRLKRIIDGMGA